MRKEKLKKIEKKKREREKQKKMLGEKI